MKIELSFIETIKEPLFYNFKLSTIIIHYLQSIAVLLKGPCIPNLQSKKTKRNIYTLNHKKILQLLMKVWMSRVNFAN